ncbi:unnamed protein product [Urochloa humidicola]
MGLRRFLNIVTLNRKSGIYSLRRMDLSRLDLFFSDTPRKAEQKKLNVHNMESVRLPAASLRFHPNPSPDAIHHKWKVDCFGLSENRIICADNCGLAFLYDAGARAVVPLPSLHYPKRCPISLSVPNIIEHGRGGGACLYVMEKVPRPRPAEAQVEAFVYGMSEMSYERTWQRRSLPPPPYALEPGYETSPTLSYALLGGGSHVCVSAMGRGTYCLDTAAGGEWSRAAAGDDDVWTLPFHGKVEYVPEHDVWFGISDTDFLPCASSDLSRVLDGERPELCAVWRNRWFPPPEWESFMATQIVSLGAGRFCMLDFFYTEGVEVDYGGNRVIDDAFAVFTGVELLPYGERRFRIVNHRSKLYRSDGNTAIEVVL